MAVPADRRQLLWEEMDRLLNLAARMKTSPPMKRPADLGPLSLVKNAWLDDAT